MKKTKTIIVIGDDIDSLSYLKFKKQKRYLKRKNIVFKTVTYASILKNELPRVSSSEILILLFFPLYYWDNEIEKNFVGGRVYGDRKCIEMFHEYLDKVERIISIGYHDKIINYVNTFAAVKIDRDKELTKSIFKKCNVPIPKSYYTRKYGDIRGLLKKGEKLYLKVNFGAMGKGITRLEEGKWLTNFIYRKGSIISRKGDYGWRFKAVTGNGDFLKELLRKELVVEKAIDPWIIDDKKFDIRYYVVYGKVRHIIIRSNSAEHVVTNITQGGNKEKKSFLKAIPGKYLRQAEKNAIKAAKALKLNFSGIDVMFSKRGVPYVIEAQSFPEFPESKYRLSVKLGRAMIKNLKREGRS